MLAHSCFQKATGPAERTTEPSSTEAYHLHLLAPWPIVIMALPQSPATLLDKRGCCDPLFLAILQTSGNALAMTNQSLESSLRTMRRLTLELRAAEAAAQATFEDWPFGSSDVQSTTWSLACAVEDTRSWFKAALTQAHTESPACDRTRLEFAIRYVVFLGERKERPEALGLAKACFQTALIERQSGIISDDSWAEMWSVLRDLRLVMALL